MRLFVPLALLLALASPALAQVQIGGHYSALALEYPDQTRHGAGAFFVYSPREWLGVDVSTMVFAAKDVGGSAWQLLAGPRVGGTFSGLGVFGRVRPGLIRFSERFYAPEIICIAIFPPPEGCLASATNVALDLGATVEVSPNGSTVLRFDIGDTLTRYRRGDARHHWKHGLQFNAGVGWAF